MSSDATSLQNTAIANANAYSAQMQKFIAVLDNYATEGSGAITFTNTLNDAALLTELQTLLSEASLVPPALATTPAYTPAIPPSDITNSPAITPPVAITIVPPSFVAPVAPVVGTDAFSGSLVPINYPVAPAAPTINLPVAPAFSNVVMPTITDIVIPTLTALAPSSLLPDPTDLFQFSEAGYNQTTQFTTAQAKLLHDIIYGGYGIEVQDEEGLWDRAKDRELRAASDATDDIVRAMAVRGFDLPPGAMLAQLAAVQQAGIEKVSQLSREIALKRADMYVENRKFTIVNIKDYEQLTMAIYNAMMERALNAAKAVAEFSIEVYNASIAKYRILMEAFAIQVQAYGEQVRAQVAQIEAQRLKLQVVQTQVDVEKAEVQLYVAQVEGQKLLVEMYRTDVSAMEGLAQVEHLKLDTFRTQIEVYAELLRAQTLQLQGYEAQTRGDYVQTEIYATKVNAQLVQAKFAETQAQINDTNARIAIENLRANLAIIQSNTEVYKAQAQGTALTNEAQARTFQARTEAFRSIAGIMDTIGRLEIAGADLNLKAAYEGQQLGIDYSKAVLANRVSAAGIAVDALSRGIQANLGQVLGISAGINSSTS